jgi:peroxiredoxin
MKNKLIIFFIILILILSGLNYYTLIRTRKFSYKIPNIKGINSFGDSFNLYENNSTFILLIFISSECVHCGSEYKYWNKLYNEYAEHNLKIIGIIYQSDSEKELDAIIEKMQFTTIVDTNGKIYKKYGLDKSEGKKILVNGRKKTIIHIDSVHKSPAIQKVFYEIIKKIADLS